MKAQRNLWRGKGKLLNIIVVLLILIFVSPAAMALPNWDIYNDAVIEAGDEYNVVSVYDSPPETTTVDMTGGWVDTVGTYDESTFNISGGEINTFNAYESSSVNASGGGIFSLKARDISILNVSNNVEIENIWTYENGIVYVNGGIIDDIGIYESGFLHLSGGLVTDSLSAGDSGTIGIYGYDLQKFDTDGTNGVGYVTGKWSDYTNFTINLYGSDTYSHIDLHEIPEPTTILIMSFGSIVLLRHKK